MVHTDDEWYELFNPFHDKLGRFSVRRGGVARSAIQQTDAARADKAESRAKKWVKEHKKELIAAGIIIGVAAAYAGTAAVGKSVTSKIVTRTTTDKATGLLIHYRGVGKPPRASEFNRKLFKQQLDTISAKVATPDVRDIKVCDRIAFLDEFNKASGKRFANARIGAAYLLKLKNGTGAGAFAAMDTRQLVFGHGTGKSEHILTHELLHLTPRLTIRPFDEESLVDALSGKLMSRRAQFHPEFGYPGGRLAVEEVLKGHYAKTGQVQTLASDIDLLRQMLWIKPNTTAPIGLSVLPTIDIDMSGLPKEELIQMACRHVINGGTDPEALELIADELERLVKNV